MDQDLRKPQNSQQLTLPVEKVNGNNEARMAHDHNISPSQYLNLVQYTKI